jgi:ABC-type Na+ transport system ATPase subunit NatA
LSDVAEVADHIAIIDQWHILHTGALADINQWLEEFFAETVAHAH